MKDWNLVILIESVNCSKYQQANCSLELFIKTKSLLCSQLILFFFPFFPVDVCFWLWELRGEFISCYGSRRGKKKKNSSAVTEHNYLKNSWNREDEVPEGELRAAGEGSHVTQRKGISQTREPHMEAPPDFSLTLPLISAFTSHVDFQGPQARKIRNR